MKVSTNSPRGVAKPAQASRPAKLPTPGARGADGAIPAAKKPGPSAPVDSHKAKNKLVRDSFTIPKGEYMVLDALKLRAAKAGRPAKKSELLRAGIAALAAMNDSKFAMALGAVVSIKTGRPRTEPVAE